VHPIHSMFDSKLGFSCSVEGTIGAICGSMKSKMAATVMTSQPVSRSLDVWSYCGFFGVSQSNGASFSDLCWSLSPVSRSQYSLKVNLSQTIHVHPTAKYITALCVYDVYTVSEYNTTAFLNDTNLARSLSNTSAFYLTMIHRYYYRHVNHTHRLSHLQPWHDNSWTVRAFT